MAALTFFNPASLLPGPDVAVTPPPQDNTMLTIIGGAMNEYNRIAQEKRQIDALKSQAKVLGGYLGQTDPALGKFVTDTADTFKLGVTDPVQASQALMNGTLKFAELASSERRANAARDSYRNDNLIDDKLRFAQKDLDMAIGQEQKWEAAELQRQRDHDKMRIAMANQGQIIPPYVPGKNPYTAIVEEKRGAAQNAFDSTPNSVATSRRGSAPALPAASGSSITSADQALGGFDGNGGDLFPDTAAPTEPVAISPLIDNSAPMVDPAPPMAYPVAEAVSEEPPQLTEGEAAPGISSSFPDIDTITQAPLTGGDNPPAPVTQYADPSADPITQLANQRKASFDASVKTTKTSFTAIADAVSANRKAYESPEEADKVEQFAREAATQLEALPGRGTPEWNRQANELVSAVKFRYESLRRRSVDQQAKKEAKESQETVKAFIKDDPKKTPLDIIVRDTASGKRYYAINADGVEQDVTLKVKGAEAGATAGDFVLLSAGSQTNVTTPGVSMPSVIDKLRQIK